MALNKNTTAVLIAVIGMISAVLSAAIMNWDRIVDNDNDNDGLTNQSSTAVAGNSEYDTLLKYCDELLAGSFTNRSAVTDFLVKDMSSRPLALPDPTLEVLPMPARIARASENLNAQIRTIESLHIERSTLISRGVSPAELGAVDARIKQAYIPIVESARQRLQQLKQER